MKESNVQKTSFTIDLTKVEGNGTIKCPKCGVEISPDDTTDEVYTVLEPIVKGDALSKIVLQCNKCQSRINLVGFRSANRRNA